MLLTVLAGHQLTTQNTRRGQHLQFDPPGLPQTRRQRVDLLEERPDCRLAPRRPGPRKKSRHGVTVGRVGKRHHRDPVLPLRWRRRLAIVALDRRPLMIVVVAAAAAPIIGVASVISAINGGTTGVSQAKASAVINRLGTKIRTRVRRLKAVIVVGRKRNGKLDVGLSVEQTAPLQLPAERGLVLEHARRRRRHTSQPRRGHWRVAHIRL